MKAFFSIIFITSFIFTCSVGYAQNFNMEPTLGEQKLFGLKVDKPFFQSNNSLDISELSGVYTLYAKIPFKNGWNILFDVPYILIKNSTANESGLGNIFFRVKRPLNEKGNSSFTIGSILPTIGKYNYTRSEVAISSNVYRALYTIPSTISIYVNFAFQLPDERDEIFGVEFGPDIVIPYENNSPDPEVYLHTGLKAGYKFKPFWLWSEWNFLMLVSEGGLDLEDRILHQLVLGGQFRLGQFNPGVFYTVHLSDALNTSISGVLGVKLEIEIGKKEEEVPTMDNWEFKR